MKLDQTVVEELFFDEYDDNIYEIIDEGDWNQNIKYQLRTIIFKFENLLYSITASRSGSPFTDWHYDWDTEACRVEPVTKTTTVYKVVCE